MRKLVLMSIVLLSSAALFAQTQQGSIMLSGATGLQFSNTTQKSVYDGKTGNENTLTNFSIIPTVVYFVVDNLAVGLSSTISVATREDEDGDKRRTTSTLLMPTAIYYFPITGKLKPFAQVGIGYQSEVEKYIPKKGSDEKDKYSGMAFGFGGGLSYFVTEHVSFNLDLSYSKFTLVDGDDDKREFRSSGISSNIGIAVFF